MIKADVRDLHKLQRALMDANRRALPFATRQAINDQAFAAQTQWRKDLPSRMVLRSRYPITSIQVDRAKGLNIATQQAVVGSVAELMKTQELGATQSKRGKIGIPIPGKPLGKKRMPKAHQLGSIRLMPRVSGPRSRQVAASLSMARKRSGPQFAFLQLKGGRQGIYQLDPSKKKLPVRKIWSLGKSSVTIPRNPTMGPAVQRALPTGAESYRKALTFQLRRLGMQGSL